MDQFHFLEEFFEGKVIKPQIENSEPVEKEKFIPDANAEFKFEQYLNSHKVRIQEIGRAHV